MEPDSQRRPTLNCVRCNQACKALSQLLDLDPRGKADLLGGQPTEDEDIRRRDPWEDATETPPWELADSRDSVQYCKGHLGHWYRILHFLEELTTLC